MQEASEVAVLEGREIVVEVAIMLSSRGSYSGYNGTIAKLLGFFLLFEG